MNAAEHRAAARRLVPASEGSLSRHCPPLAGEVLWGAAINALDALAHERGERHLGDMRQRRRFGLRMIADVAPAQSDMDALHKSAARLHNHWQLYRKIDACYVVCIDKRYNNLMGIAYKTYRLRAYGDAAVHRHVDSALSLTWEIYNAALRDRRERRRLGRQSVTKYDQYRALTNLRREMPDCAAMMLVILREPIDWLDKAYRAFYRRIKAGEKPGYPRYKGRRWWKSIGTANVYPGMVKPVGGGKYNIRL